MPEYDVLRLRVRPLETADFDTHAETVPRQVLAVRMVIGPELLVVVIVVVHHRKTLLVGRGSLSEIAVPRPVPGMILVRPGVRPCPRVDADRGREGRIDRGARLEVPRTGLEPHYLPVRPRCLPLAVPGFHDVDRHAGSRVDLREDERRRAVAVVHPRALRHLHRMKRRQVHVQRIGRVVADHAEVPEFGPYVVGVMRPFPLDGGCPPQRGRGVDLRAESRSRRHDRQGEEKNSSVVHGWSPCGRLYCGEFIEMPTSTRRGG